MLLTLNLAPSSQSFGNSLQFYSSAHLLCGVLESHLLAVFKMQRERRKRVAVQRQDVPVSLPNSDSQTENSPSGSRAPQSTDAFGFPALGLQVVTNCLMWVL